MNLKESGIWENLEGGKGMEKMSYYNFKEKNK